MKYRSRQMQIALAKSWWEDEACERLSQHEWAKVHGLNPRTFERYIQVAREAGEIPVLPKIMPNGASPGDRKILTDRWLEIPDRMEITVADAARRLRVNPDTLRENLRHARKIGYIPMSTERKRIRRSGPVNPNRDDELREEWEHLRGFGVNIEEAARRLDTTVHTLKRLQEAS